MTEVVVGFLVAGTVTAVVVWLLRRGARDRRADHDQPSREPDITQPGNTDSDEPPISIVALMTELPYLDIDVLQRALESEFDLDFDDADRDPEATPTGDASEDSELELRFADGNNFAMETPTGSYMVRLGGHMHGVIAHDSLYFEDCEQAAESLSDLRGQQALLNHRCWMAVDHVGDPPDTQTMRETYVRIGQLLLAIIDPTLCTAVLLPHAQKFYPWRDGMEESLTSGDVLGDLDDTAHVPVAGIDGNDPEMQEAVAKAQEHWPDFVAAFESRRGEAFGVKFRLPGDDEESFEFPWLEVTAIHGEIIQGKLANEPIGRSDLREGSKVTTRLADMNDWLYINERGEQQGGFTIPVLLRGMQEGGGDDN